VVICWLCFSVVGCLGVPGCLFALSGLESSGFVIWLMFVVVLVSSTDLFASRRQSDLPT